MLLMTDELEKRFKEIGRQENSKDPIVVAKYFNPCGAGTWYATEYNPKERMFFGYVSLFGTAGMDEWGYFGLDELIDLELPFGFTIERDLFCGEKAISQFNIPTLK